jgi:hypothetical protein
MLAVATLGGLGAWAAGYETIGLTLAAFGCLSMLVAAIALISSAPQLKRGAAVQAVPSLIFLVLLMLHLNAG